jgi:hypothetical protein
MTDLTKARAFATHCLKWTKVTVLQYPNCTLIVFIT